MHNNIVGAPTFSAPRPLQQKRMRNIHGNSRDAIWELLLIGSKGQVPHWLLLVSDGLRRVPHGVRVKAERAGEKCVAG
jgi:hypothetical protein